MTLQLDFLKNVKSIMCSTKTLVETTGETKNEIKQKKVPKSTFVVGITVINTLSVRNAFSLNDTK